MLTLVTGATGFIGTNLVRRLVELGHSVRILRRRHSNMRGLEDLPIETALGDVRDIDSVRQALEGCEHVYHLAAKLNVASSDWERFRQTNVLGTENVARAALEAGIARFLHCSSVAAVGWGPPEAPATEESEFNLSRFHVPYIHTKRQAEVTVQRFVEQGLPAVIVNPSYVFGPWDKRLGANRLVYIVASGRGLLYPGKGGINIVDVADVVEGMIAVMERGRVGQRYILGGENLFFRELFGLVAELTSRPKPIGPVPFPLFWSVAVLAEVAGRVFGLKPLISRELARISGITHFVSSEKARKELGYRSRPAREIVRRSLAWLVREGYLPALADRLEEELAAVFPKNPAAAG